MKKFLITLLTVATCMTALATTPRVNANVRVASGKPGASLLTKNNTLAQQLMAPAVGQPQASSSHALTPQRFFAERGVTPSDNRLTKKAPRRVSEQDVLFDKLAFMTAYEYDAENDMVELSKDYMIGGWDVVMEEVDDNYYYAYLYYESLPFSICVDYNTNTAEMVMEYLGGWQWSDTTQSGRFTIISDTTEYLFLIDETYLMDETAEDFTNLTGTVYEDGSIYFPDGWCVYDVCYTQKTVTRSGTQSSVTYDTIAGMVTDFMRDTYLLTPNAVHDYDYAGSSSTASHYQNLAYMYQYDDTTAIAWNLWGMGGRGAEFHIYEDGSMVFPCMQVIATGDVEALEAAYPNYDWQTYGYYFFNVDADGDPVDQTGTVTPEALAWDATAWGRICVDNSPGAGGEVRSVTHPTVEALSGTSAQTNSATYMANYYPMLNNVVTFTNEYDYFIFGDTERPVITTEVTDDYVIVTATPADDLETYVELYLCENGTPYCWVDNPYCAERTDEAYTITFAAIAQAYGKNVSEWTTLEVTVPKNNNEPFPSLADNRFSFDLDGDERYILSGETKIIPVSLENSNTVTAFQTDLYLPPSIELVNVELSERAVDHVCEYSVMPDGAIRILCYSNTLTAFEGNSGELFYLTVTASEWPYPYDDEYGYDDIISLKRNLLTIVWGDELNCKEIQIQNDYNSLLIYLMGDANDNASITVTDIVVTAQYILGQSPRPFVFKAADMNHNGEISVTDAVLIARKILYPEYSSMMRAPALNQNHDAMSGEGINIRAGETRTVTIALDNEVDYTAFQLDLQLPDGLTASNFCLTDRAGNHTVEANMLENGKQRVMCYSPQLETIVGDKGALLTFEVTASDNVWGDIMVDGIEMVTAACQTAYLDGFAIQVNSEGTTALQDLGGDLRITAEGHDIIIDSPVAQRAIISDVAGHARSVNLNAGRNVITEGGNGVFIVRVGQQSAKLMLK